MDENAEDEERVHVRIGTERRTVGICDGMDRITTDDVRDVEGGEQSRRSAKLDGDRTTSKENIRRNKVHRSEAVGGRTGYLKFIK